MEGISLLPMRNTSYNLESYKNIELNNILFYDFQNKSLFILLFFIFISIIIIIITLISDGGGV